MPNINEVFMQANNQLSMDDLIPFTEDNYLSIQKTSWLKNSFEEVEALLISNNMIIENLYYSSNHTTSFWYMQKHACTPVHMLDEEYFAMCQIKKAVVVQEAKLEELWNSEKYEEYFTSLQMMAEAFSFFKFTQKFNEIPEELRYRIFKDIYISCEYGFGNLDKKMVESVFSSNKDRSFIKDLKVDENQEVTIYRGFGEKSSSLYNSYSWSTNLNTAIFFASKTNDLKAKVYKAKVSVEDIIDYIDDRNEKEILILPENLKNIESMGFINYSEDLLYEFELKKNLTLYQTARDSILDKSWFFEPEGIHGTLHTVRVLLLALLISYFSKLSKKDRLILVYSSLMHDIGRDNNDRDDYHGEKSVTKLELLELDKTLVQDYHFTSEEVSIVKVIIKNHSINDEIGIKDILNTEKIKNKKRAIDLYKKFKDADNLDRVRLGNLNMNYLRNDISKNLVLIAHQLLRNLK